MSVENNKPRRAYNSGRIYSLYPFPRSGRSDPEFAKFNRISKLNHDEDDKNGGRSKKMLFESDLNFLKYGSKSFTYV